MSLTLAYTYVFGLCIGYQPRSIIRSDYILAEYVTDMFVVLI